MTEQSYKVLSGKVQHLCYIAVRQYSVYGLPNEAIKQATYILSGNAIPDKDLKKVYLYLKNLIDKTNDFYPVKDPRQKLQIRKFDGAPDGNHMLSTKFSIYREKNGETIHITDIFALPICRALDIQKIEREDGPNLFNQEGGEK